MTYQMNPNEPKRLSLANLPTPFARLKHTSEWLGREFWIKRDDMTGTVLSGNKIRKLEYLLAEAKSKECDVLITAGGEQSNHARATAIAGAQLGFKSHLLLRTDNPKRPPALEGNLLLNTWVGAKIEWLSKKDWPKRNEKLEEIAEKYEGQGLKPYVIPVGGSNPLGTWGYVRAVYELDTDFKRELKDKKLSLVYACGSGGTGAGLLIGAKHLGWDHVNITGVNVCDDRAYFEKEITTICNDFEKEWPEFKSPEKSSIDLLDGYVGRGYGLTTPDETATIRELAQRDGIFLDTTYTGKAYFGLVSEIAKNPDRFSKHIVFLHTGGVFGLFTNKAVV